MTVGLDPTARRWKVASASSTDHRRRDDRRHAAIAARAGLAGRRRPASASATRSRRSSRPRRRRRAAGLGAVQRRRHARRAARPRRRLPDADRRRRPGVRVDRPRHAGRVAARVPGSSSTPATARVLSRAEPRRAQPRRAAAGVRVRRHAAGDRRRLRHAQARPVHRRGRRPRARDRRLRERGQRRCRTSSLRLYFATRRWSPRPTRSSPPSGSATRPPAAFPPGDYFVQVCEFERRRPAGRAAHLPRHRDARQHGRAAAVHWPAGACSRPNPPLNALRPTRGTTRARTRARTGAGGQSTAGDCDRVVGNLASRAPWDHDPRTTRRRTRRSATTRARPSPGRTRAAEPDAVPAGQRGARLHVPVDERVERGRLQPGHAVRRGVRARASFDIAAAVTNLFVMHNRMHDWSLLLGFTEAELERAGRQLRPDRGVPRERPGDRQRAGRRARAAAAASCATTRT